MSLIVRSVSARTPWGAGTFIPDEAAKETAPRQDVPYRCAKGCEFTVPFAAEVVPPDDWDCCCGALARREGAPEGTPASPHLPGLRSGAGRYDRPGPGTDVTPMGQLRKRRTKKQGDAILAEALERARQTGAAR